MHFLGGRGLDSGLSSAHYRGVLSLLLCHMTSAACHFFTIKNIRSTATPRL
jgi:hypothetical protein